MAIRSRSSRPRELSRLLRQAFGHLVRLQLEGDQVGQQVKDLEAIFGQVRGLRIERA
jgi:hypothetical protein